MLNWRKALQFSSDLAIRPEWFKRYEISVYGGDNSLDIQKIDRPDAAFDFISLNHVIEFVVDAKAAFFELARVLSAKGIIQVGFSQLETRAVSVDYPDAQGVHGYYHLFGLDCATYFDIRSPELYMIDLAMFDDCTSSTEEFHFFSRDLGELVKLKTYSALDKL